MPGLGQLRPPSLFNPFSVFVIAVCWARFCLCVCVLCALVLQKPMTYCEQHHPPDVRFDAESRRWVPVDVLSLLPPAFRPFLALRKDLAAARQVCAVPAPWPPCDTTPPPPTSCPSRLGLSFCALSSLCPVATQPYLVCVDAHWFGCVCVWTAGLYPSPHAPCPLRFHNTLLPCSCAIRSG
jgi:hypothetical protein